MRNKRIAVFSNGYGNEFLEHIVSGIHKKAKADGIDVFVFVTYCSLLDHELQNKCQLNIFHLPNPEDFDGAVMLTNTYNFPDEHERICACFQRAGVPMLSLEVDVPNMSCIKTENYKGMKDLALHLVEKHDVKKILYFNGVKGNAENAIRRQAVIDVLNEHGLELFDEIDCDFSFYSAYVRMNAYLNAGKELPDAVVCANDEMALGVNSSVFEHGFRVPEDVIVTGFDMIKNGQHTIPILATVSRGWDTFGEKAYDKLMYQIAHPDERFNETYDSFFVPSESCGCKPSDAAVDARFCRIRQITFDTLQKSIMDIFFQRLQVPLSIAEHKEDFYELGVKDIMDVPMLGPDYCLCTEPEFFEIDDDNYTERIRGYSSRMDIIYELKGNVKQALSHFDSRELYPGYSHPEGESNLYIFAPLNHLNFIIGYIAIKNSPSLLYDLQLSSWIRSMNALLFNMRRHIFAQRDNKELKRIYMTDALTGIYNRTGCEKVLYKHITDLKSRRIRSILVFADIDRMKTINDVYGHLNGDLAIKATAEAFVAYSPDDWLFGRYGGDEFIAVGACPETDKLDDFLKTLSDSMSKRFKSLNLSFMLHASLGYTVIEPRDNGTIDDYIQRADQSMYSEKEKIHKLMDSMNFKA